jgi:hypothetical protein
VTPLEGVGVERLRIYVEEKLPFIFATNLGVVSSNLVGRATADEDGHCCFAVAL